MAVVGTATELETAAADLVRNVIVADLRMPPGNQMDGISTALRIRRRQPAVGIVVLSQHADPHYTIALLSGVPPASLTCSRSAQATRTSSWVPCAAWPSGSR